MSGVLILHAADSALEPAHSEVVNALNQFGIASHLFLPDQALLPQFFGVDAVIDIGGWGRSEHVQAAREAGTRLWQVLGYGLDHLAVADVIDASIPLARIPGSSTSVPLAEHAMHLMLAVAKNANLARAALENQHFFDGNSEELFGKTLLIIGLGASGIRLASTAGAFQIRVIGIDTFESFGIEESCIDEYLPVGELERGLREANLVSLHLPLTSKTRHILDRKALEQLQVGTIVVNVARGSLIDQCALIEVLRSGHLRGAGLDVFEDEPLPLDSPLLDMWNVVLTPHWASATRATASRRARIAAESVARFIRGESPHHLVRPECL